MLRLVQIGNTLPFSFPVDPAATFLPGMIAQLTVSGNAIVCGVSDGTGVIGVLDDIHSKAFEAAAVNETVIVPSMSTMQNGRLVSVVDIKTELANPNITANSFVSNPIDLILIPRNGVVVFPAGTPLNFDMTGSGTFDAIRTVVSYRYMIPNIPGDSSIEGSGRVTVWFNRIIAETDQFETNVPYAVNATLFCNESGLFTTRQITPSHPGVALCTAPPNSIMGSLQFMWF